MSSNRRTNRPRRFQGGDFFVGGGDWARDRAAIDGASNRAVTAPRSAVRDAHRTVTAHH